MRDDILFFQSVLENKSPQKSYEGFFDVEVHNSSGNIAQTAFFKAYGFGSITHP